MTTQAAVRVATTPLTPQIPRMINPLPTCSDASKYTTVEQLEAKAGLIDLWCGPQYTITILLQILQDLFARYDEIMASGYYKYFKIYADYLVSNAWAALRNFMLIHGDEYFNRKITEETTCCNVCKAEGVSCHNSAMSSRLLKTRDKEGDFWDAAAAEVGAPREKMSIVKLQSVGMLDSSCSRDSVYNGIEHMTASCYYRNFWFDATQINGFNTDDVTNPKTILNKALIGAGIGLGIYDMVQTPSAIPVDLFGILFSVKGIRDVSNARKAALARGAMPHADIDRISTKAAAELEQIS
ncbi:hypothetical protein CGCS363_v000145 [Colletotrichum siamense]|uniref:uncharacterized protein n=1 Tax=Colletotrichum siamense TaxID=690259 RepID=UPI00187303C5|nr:uncharacterized protein CGCS363_v000145 [Colletotrichum siamense]KAF5515412.1 hypothetical protein CGCS363_v000145 [Colletotrichum siamense]